MARMNATEREIGSIKRSLQGTVPEELKGDFCLLFEAAELGLRGYRVVLSMKPLVTAVWVSMTERGDPNRFAVERMLREIDELIDFWVVKDEAGGGGKEIESDGGGR